MQVDKIDRVFAKRVDVLDTLTHAQVDAAEDVLARSRDMLGLYGMDKNALAALADLDARLLAEVRRYVAFYRRWLHLTVFLLGVQVAWGLWQWRWIAAVVLPVALTAGLLVVVCRDYSKSLRERILLKDGAQ